MNPTETVTEASRAPALEIGGKVLARNAVLNVAGQVVPLLVGVATMPYVIRHLGPDRFGLLSLAWMLVGYFALFDLGIGFATTKFVAELLGKGDIEKVPALVWTALVTQSGFGLLAGILLAAASPTFVNRLLKIPPGLRPDAHWVFLIDEGALVLQILAVGVLINSLAFVPYYLLRGLGRPDLTANFHLLEVPLHVALAWFLVTGFGLPGAALAWTLRVSLDFLLLIVAACWISRTSPRLLVGRQIRRSVATLTALAVSLSVLWAISHALLANALLALLLTAGFLVGTWHYVLDLEEKWHIRLWLKAAL